MICDLEFGHQTLRLRLPDTADLLALPDDPALPYPSEAIRLALAHPIGAPALSKLVRDRIRAQHGNAGAVIVASDNTRPVPYKGSSGILTPIIGILRTAGAAGIKILIATGTHRPLSDAELRALLPDDAFAGDISIINHVCTDAGQLRDIGRTPRGTQVAINRHYLDAGIKILTGLVEPHFMAGASGGPKSICPGIVGEQVTHVFHGPELMDDERCASLNCDDNPCHAESTAVAQMAGVDFIVNVTINGAKELTGVFAGGMSAAHRAAVARLLKKGAIRIDREYDIVVSHAGFAGINHYQAAKAAVEAAKAARAGGVIILAANHTDQDPVGGANYRRVLPMLKQYGPEKCTRLFFDSAWTFIPEQWEAQMWARVFRKLGNMNNLIYCAPRLTGALFQERGIPGRDGGDGRSDDCGDDRARAESMMQKAVDECLRANPTASLAVMTNGPYGVPYLRGFRPRN